MSLHRRITINVAYDEATVDDEDELDEGLRQRIENYVGDGLFSPNGEYVVEEWDVSIEKRR